MRLNFTHLACVSAIVAAVPAQTYAGGYTTPLIQEAYTMSALAKTAGSGVTEIENGVFIMANDVTISAGNTFSISGVKELRMADGVLLTIECAADMAATARAKVTKASSSAAPKGIVIDYSPGDAADNTKVANIDFEYAALRDAGALGLDVDNCTFAYANGKLNSTAALALGPSGATYNITNCEFSHCAVPAIGGAANYFCGINIKNCTFTDNNTSNTNKPQVNITVGGNLPVTIEDCAFVGAGRNMVGGIGVGNLTVGAGTNKVYITNCDIRGHRYGITGTGPMSMEIRDCTMIDNNHETNPMNGGSGISLAGYNYGLDAIVSGCHIENSLWGITLIQCRNVSLGQAGSMESPGNNVFVNNGNGGIPYDLYNNGASDVMAQNNTWSVAAQTAENIESVIFHKPDNASLGLVTFLPAKENAGAADISASPSEISFDGETLRAQGPITVYGVTGQKAGASASATMSVSHLAPGIYLARSNGSTIKFTKR